MPPSAIALSFVQVTFCPDAEQFQFVPQEPAPVLEKVKAEFRVSVTVIGSLPPVGSPVEPVLPLVVMPTVYCAFDSPFQKAPTFARSGCEIVTGFSAMLTHQPLAAPAPALYPSSVLMNRLHVPLALLLPLGNTLANVEEPWLAA